MHAAALLLLAEVAGPALPAHADIAAVCPAPAVTTDIVVCGRSAGTARYRLSDHAAGPDPALPPAEIGIGETRIGITTGQASIGGVPSNRVMVRLRIPLGRRR